jgi:hypothetical protein
MTQPPQWMKQLLLAGCLAAIGAGCAVHARYYDPVYSDYHVWGPPEAGYYNRWIVETHHPNVEYQKLRPEEQRTYWTWRHAHGNDHK